MDVNLPGIDGLEATRIAQRASPHRPVVVLLSTYDEDEFNRDNCGAAAYVPKGVFGPDRLDSGVGVSHRRADRPRGAA